MDAAKNNSDFQNLMAKYQKNYLWTVQCIGYFLISIQNINI
jgi:hypothetical protein